MYRKYPGWIKAIYIRKVTDAPHMTEKNKAERFEKAFEGIPKDIWMLFEDPRTLEQHASRVAREA